MMSLGTEEVRNDVILNAESAGSASLGAKSMGRSPREQVRCRRHIHSLFLSCSLPLHSLYLPSFLYLSSYVLFFSFAFSFSLQLLSSLAITHCVLIILTLLTINVLFFDMFCLYFRVFKIFY